MYLSVDVEDTEILSVIEDEVERAVKLESKLMADREKTKQFEGIQKELESYILRHVDERMAEIQTDIENRVEEEIYNLNQSLNAGLNDELRLHVYTVVDKTVKDVMHRLKVTVDAPVVRGELYLETGEGTAGKERAAKEYDDMISMEDS